MFTGIVEGLGKIKTISRGAESARITIDAGHLASDAHLGDSIAINGVCLTVVQIAGAQLSFEAVAETLRKTGLGDLNTGDPVNLERSLAVGGRMGGHFVLGHVDGRGKVLSIEPHDNARIVKIAPPAELWKYIAKKGSITVDGISLTVADVTPDHFSLWIIPHTWENTALHIRSAGESVNLEIDVLSRYVERLMESREPHRNPGSVTEGLLLNAGFTA